MPLKRLWLLTLALPPVCVLAQGKSAPAKPSEVGATAVIIGDPVEYALALKREGKLQEARMVLEKALEADPRNWKAHHVLGWLCLEMKDKQAAIRHLRRAVYLGPPCSEEVNLDARTVNRLLSGRRGPGFALRGPTARFEMLQMMAPAVFLSGLGEQLGLGERERGMLFGLGMLLGKMAKRLEPYEDEMNRHIMALVSAAQAENWSTVGAELQALGGIFQRAAQGGPRTDEARLLGALGKGLQKAAPYIARQDMEGAARVFDQEIEPVVERIVRRMMKQAKALAKRAKAEAGVWRKRLEEWMMFQQILNLPPVSPMVSYSPVGVRIRE